MRAILFPKKDEVKALDLPDPVAGANDVIVRVRASGICHTDIEVLKGNYGSSAFPLVPGHEFSGVIAEVGAGVTGLRSGDAVVVDPNLECGTCDACERGYAHLCERLGAYGVTVNGGFAEYCMVKASAVHPIHDLPFHLAALAEPMGCVLNGVEAADGANADAVSDTGNAHQCPSDTLCLCERHNDAHLRLRIIDMQQHVNVLQSPRLLPAP